MLLAPLTSALPLDGKTEKTFGALERPAHVHEPARRRDERALLRTRAALAPRRVGQRGR